MPWSAPTVIGTANYGTSVPNPVTIGVGAAVPTKALLISGACTSDGAYGSTWVTDSRGNPWQTIRMVSGIRPGIYVHACVVTVALTTADHIYWNWSGSPNQGDVSWATIMSSASTSPITAGASNAAGPTTTSSLSVTGTCRLGDLVVGVGATAQSGTGGDARLGGTGWTDIANFSNGQSHLDMAYKIATSVTETYTVLSGGWPETAAIADFAYPSAGVMSVRDPALSRIPGIN